MNRIRLGIFGVVRGLDLAENFLKLGCNLVAVCDNRDTPLKEAESKLGKEVAIYTNFDKFLNHGLDAVILANYFHEHTPYAIKCFEKGIHVFSECISNSTMAEGVELIRAFEKSNSIYMLAENYPQMKFTLEMKRLVDSGTLGKILYAEGEYNHPMTPGDVNFNRRRIYSATHWRNYCPRSYYITHSLGPVMRATGATPVRVTALNVFAPDTSPVPNARYAADRVSVITTQNNDGTIFRVTGCAAFGAHHNSYRICGTEGQIENLRGMGEKVMLRYNAWSKPADAEEVKLYEPEWNDIEKELIESSGHGGSDYITARMFVECIRENKQPEHPFDIHSAVTMSSVAILAHRSMLDGGMPYDIPDFHKEECRKQYENDRLCPFYREDGTPPNIPCCSHPDYAPTEEQLRLYKEQVTDFNNANNN